MNQAMIDKILTMFTALYGSVFTLAQTASEAVTVHEVGIAKVAYDLLVDFGGWGFLLIAMIWVGKVVIPKMWEMANNLIASIDGLKTTFTTETARLREATEQELSTMRELHKQDVEHVVDQHREEMGRVNDLHEKIITNLLTNRCPNQAALQDLQIQIQDEIRRIKQ